MSLKFINHFIF